MKNKRRELILIVILLLVLALTACQPDEPVEGLCPIDLTGAESEEPCPDELTEAEPGAEAYPAVPLAESTSPETAYPIVEADLSLLLRTWRLSAYLESGVEQETADKTLTFSADGPITLTTAEGVQTGTWSVNLQALELALVLDLEPGGIQEYEIVSLEPDELILRTWRDNIELEEIFLPAD